MAAAPDSRRRTGGCEEAAGGRGSLEWPGTVVVDYGRGDELQTLRFELKRVRKERKEEPVELIKGRGELHRAKEPLRSRCAVAGDGVRERRARG